MDMIYGENINLSILQCQRNNNIQKYGLQDYVELLYGDIETWKPFNYDLMHIDISNDGEYANRARRKLMLAMKVLKSIAGSALKRTMRKADLAMKCRLPRYICVLTALK